MSTSDISPETKPSLATDVGGVLKENNRHGDVVWIPGAKHALCNLSDHYHLSIISKVRKGRTERMKYVLRNSFVADYIPEDRWHFVHDRRKKVKIMKLYSISTLIDDRKDVIHAVEKAGLTGIHFRSKEFPDWKSVLKRLLP